MKNIPLYFLIVIFGGFAVSACLGNAVNQPIRYTKGTIAKLRRLYTSGDTTNWPAPFVDEEMKAGFQDIGHLPKVEYPADNPYSKQKEVLGKILFYDPRLSKSNQIACASCHDPELAWTDNKTFAFGHDRQNGARNAMTILNSNHAKLLFWDGRANSLEQQSEMPVQDPREMSDTFESVVDKVAKIKGYESLFRQAFGDKTISKERIGKAIATFERGVISGPTKFDRFIDGEDEAYSDQEVVGLNLFRTKARCINCHNTGYFSNNQFINDGTSLLGSKQQDLGRYIVTKDAKDVGKFRVPTLREVSRTGPWMHNGAFSPLRDVLTFYNAGNPETQKKKSTVADGRVLNSEKSPVLRKLDLSKEELDALEAFLETLSSRTKRLTPPDLPR